MLTIATPTLHCCGVSLVAVVAGTRHARNRHFQWAFWSPKSEHRISLPPPLPSATPLSLPGSRKCTAERPSGICQGHRPYDREPFYPFFGTVRVSKDFSFGVGACNGNSTAVSAYNDSRRRCSPQLDAVPEIAPFPQTAIKLAFPVVHCGLEHRSCDTIR